jgi:transposase
LLKDPKKLKPSQREVLQELKAQHGALYRAYLIKEALRDVYRAGQAAAPERLDAWLAWACRSRIPAMVQLSQTIRAHRKGIEVVGDHTQRPTSGFHASWVAAPVMETLNG